MKNKIYLSSPHMGGLEMKYINEAFEANWIAPLGKNVTEFENEMCNYIGTKQTVALSSGTAAIHLGLKYLGVKEGDIVFCQSFTFSGSCFPINYSGAKPVFIDSDYETWNISYKALKKAYEKYPNPKALIIVNLYGNPADFDNLISIAKKHNTPILEDAAESLGSTYNGIQTGTFGDVGVFSFNGNKIITTSGGGMAIVPDADAKSKFIFWATQAREKFLWYQHEEIGYNYRLSNICAGIGRGQLKVLDERIQRKNEIYNIYKECFKNNKHISLIPEPANSKPNHWLTVMTLSQDCNVSVIDILKSLEKENIEARPAWKPMHMQPVYKNCDFFSSLEKGSVCEDLFKRSLCLPSDTKMTDEQVKYVAEIINGMVK